MRVSKQLTVLLQIAVTWLTKLERIPVIGWIFYVFSNLSARRVRNAKVFSGCRAKKYQHGMYKGGRLVVMGCKRGRPEKHPKTIPLV